MRRNYCRSVISLQEPLPQSLWVSLDLHGILAIVWTPAYSVVCVCVCWPPKRRVYNTTPSSLLHTKYLLLLCCLLKVSQYRLALIDTASVHIVEGISQHIRSRSCACWLKLKLQRGGAASVVGPSRRARTHILSTGGSFLPECASSAGVCFCWSEMLLEWPEELQLEVCIESTRLLRGPD